MSSAPGSTLAEAPLDEVDLQIITFLEQQYQLTGELLTAERADSEFAIPVGIFNKTIAKTATKKALEERGVVLERFAAVQDWTTKSLTPKQLVVANTLLDLTDTRSQKKKLQDLDVSTLTYQAWLKDPVFKHYVHTRAEQLIGDNQHEADQALLDRVRAGDLKAIAYYNEYTGRFVQTSKSDRNVDVHGIIVKIIEIIDEEILDGQTKLRVGERLKALITAQNVASALVSGTTEAEVISVPEIVKMSEITPGTPNEDAK